MQKITGGIVAAFFFIFAIWFFGFSNIFAFFLWMCSVLSLLFGIASTYFFVRIKQAELKGKIYDAKKKKYLSYKDGFGMMHLLNLKTNVVENLSAYPGTHHNGKWKTPDPVAMTSWFALINKRHGESPVTALLPSKEQQQQSLDLLIIFTQSSQSYAIIAGQQVGKTYQARQIANYWHRQNIKSIVIGPKRDVGEWSECAYFGEGYNFEKVAQGMRIIKKLAEDRHSQYTKSHKTHPIQPVFFDDWTAIKQELGTEAEEFIVEATVLYASVNIILYFIIHLDTANAWGVGKVGAALKDNFIKLLIEPGYDENGLISRRHNRGFLIRPGETKKDRVPIKLFDGMPPASGLVVDSKSEQDKKFVQMVNAVDATGKKVFTRQAASLEAYGRNYEGSFVYDCKRLLGEA